MGEVAYGTSLGCVSRRLYVLGVSAIMAALCIAQLVKWAARSHVWDVLAGNSWSVEHPEDCSGSECFEVFSCFGMKGATLHLREPLASVTGALVLPIGVIGAEHGYRWFLRLLGYYLTAKVFLDVVLIAADLLYVNTCNMYPTNIIDQTMVNWFPPSPITNAAQGVLRDMPNYPLDAVAKLTDDFPVLKWYLAVTLSLLLFLAYTAQEAWRLGVLAERGPIGLGPCYGLAQWDQVLDYATIMRIKGRETRSQFVEDCTGDVEEAAPIVSKILNNGRTVTRAGGYGSATQSGPTFRAAAATEPPLYVQQEPLYLQQEEADQDFDAPDEEGGEDDEEARLAAEAAALAEEAAAGRA